MYFKDKNGDGRIVLTPEESTNEITLDRDIIVLSTPEVAKLAPWIIALVAAGGLAAALSTASGLLLVISSSIAHNVYYPIINPEASEAKRLMVGRIMVGFAIAIKHFILKTRKRISYLSLHFWKKLDRAIAIILNSKPFW